SGMYALSLHDALPILVGIDETGQRGPVGLAGAPCRGGFWGGPWVSGETGDPPGAPDGRAASACVSPPDGVLPPLRSISNPVLEQDRKSTRLNSSHVKI